MKIPGTPWIGVDFDGTLVKDLGEWLGFEAIGEPVWPMIERVRLWLADGKDVRIFTARCFGPEGFKAVAPIEAWCERYLGRRLPVTCVKDYHMLELWDDRARQIVADTGLTLEQYHWGA